MNNIDKFREKYKRKPVKPIATFTTTIVRMDEQLSDIHQRMIAIGNRHALYAKPAISKAERELKILKQEYQALLAKNPTSKSLKSVKDALMIAELSIKREKLKFN